MTNLELLELAKTWRKRTFHGKEITLEEALRFYRIGELIAVCGTWAVTFYGLECLIHDYPIEKKRITPEQRDQWVEDMRRKSWCDLSDFIETYLIAESFFNKPDTPKRKRLAEINLRIRFKVFRRDGYRCRLCGISADEGARLEMDHIEPRSNNGADDLQNYWTLCFDCNRGKSNLEL